MVLATAAAVGAALLYTSVIEPPQGIMGAVGLGGGGEDKDGNNSTENTAVAPTSNGTIAGNSTEVDASETDKEGEDDDEEEGVGEEEVGTAPGNKEGVEEAVTQSNADDHQDDDVDDEEERTSSAIAPRARNKNSKEQPRAAALHRGIMGMMSNNNYNNKNHMDRADSSGYYNVPSEDPWSTFSSVLRESSASQKEADDSDEEEEDLKGTGQEEIQDTAEKVDVGDETSTDGDGDVKEEKDQKAVEENVEEVVTDEIESDTDADDDKDAPAAGAEEGEEEEQQGEKGGMAKYMVRHGKVFGFINNGR